MKEHKHSFLRFITDITLTLVIVLSFMTPVFLVMSLKIKDLNLKAEIIEAVAGSNSKKVKSGN